MLRICGGRHHTPQQVTLAYATAVKAVPPWPASTTALPHHWRYRLLRLQTRNHYLGIQTDHDSFTHAAIYPDTVELAAQILRPANQHTPRRSRTNREK